MPCTWNPQVSSFNLHRVYPKYSDLGGQVVPPLFLSFVVAALVLAPSLTAPAGSLISLAQVPLPLFLSFASLALYPTADTVSPVAAMWRSLAPVAALHH